MSEDFASYRARLSIASEQALFARADARLAVRRARIAAAAPAPFAATALAPAAAPASTPTLALAWRWPAPFAAGFAVAALLAAAIWWAPPAVARPARGGGHELAEYPKDNDAPRIYDQERLAAERAYDEEVEYAQHIYDGGA